MPRGNIVETAQKPQWKTVQNYRDYLKQQTPDALDWTEFFEPDIECQCCTQKAPSEAAAMLKVEDQTPVNEKFNQPGVGTAGQQGEILWLCADCYNHGVRPKYIYFGEIKWNKDGRRVKHRTEQSQGHPWHY